LPWIAIYQNDGDHIVQIGFDHDWNSSGAEHYCRFWANGTGNPHDYDCSGTSDGTTVFFRIERYLKSGGGMFYRIDDCGTEGDFNNCTREDGNQGAFTVSASAGGLQETDHPCASQMLGSNAHRTTFGNSSWGTVGEDGSGWDVHSWSDFTSSGCSTDYKESISSDIIDTWDSRN
jgi:hypothetical protein